MMPESNSEPEKYSVEEMLVRLKSRGEDAGELVTRADGTQALKVKKRKRRTDQSRDKLKAQIQRTQLLQIAGFIVVVVALLIFGGILILYANTKVFRDGLISKIESATGGEAKIQEFRMNPATASAAILKMNWPKSHAINHFDVISLRAKVSPISFLGKVFQGQEIIADQGNLFLTAPLTGELSANESDVVKNSLIRFNRYSVSNLNLFFSAEKRQDRMIENIEASYLPTMAKNGGEIRLHKGLLKMGNWPSLALDRSYIHVRGNKLEIKSMRFQMPLLENQKAQDKGSIDFTGVLSPLNEGATHELFVHLDSFQISYLLGDQLGRFFHGKAMTIADDPSNVIQFTPGSGQDAHLEANVTNALDSRISIAQFRFMGQLAITLNDRWYELPSFDDEVKLLLKRNGDTVALEDIHLEHRGKMVIRGQVSTTDQSGNIKGKLQVGIPDIIIAASENSRLDALFSDVKNGYRWIDLELGGTSKLPTDNFKQLYKAVSDTNPPKEIIVPDSSGLDTFDRLIEKE